MDVRNIRAQRTGFENSNGGDDDDDYDDDGDEYEVSCLQLLLLTGLFGTESPLETDSFLSNRENSRFL